MAQAGAQREPSMEEILASIRKIIENNDSDQPAPAARNADVPEVGPEARHSQRNDDDQLVDEERPEPSPEAAVKPAAQQESPAASLSLADIAARMRTDKQAPVGTVLDESAVRELQDLLDDERLDPGVLGSQRAEDGLQDVARAIAGMTPGLHIKSLHTDQERADENDKAAEARDWQDDEDEAVPASNAASGLTSGLGQLMSVEAGDKVAQSFAQLDAAITAGSQRSFDEIAEELLRPMLQTWLDDNLPTLVERLVREEIERVSRGTRR
jgi:uncharacterized protein